MDQLYHIDVNLSLSPNIYIVLFQASEYEVINVV